MSTRNILAVFAVILLAVSAPFVIVHLVAGPVAWALFLVVWFGVGLSQIADGLL